MIGIDTLKIFLHNPDFRIQKNPDLRKDLRLLKDNDNSENNMKQVFFTDGSADKINKIEVHGKQISFSKGGLSTWVNIPKLITGFNIEMQGHKANKQAYEYLFDKLNDTGIDFDSKQAINSRLDLCRTVSLKLEPDQYCFAVQGIPYVNDNYSIGSTKYITNGSFALCYYDKKKEIIDTKGIVPDQYKALNLARLEMRLLKPSKLKTDSKKVGFDLRCSNALTDPDNFHKVQNLYLDYGKQIFSLESMKRIEAQKKAEILHDFMLCAENGIPFRDAYSVLLETAMHNLNIHFFPSLHEAIKAYRPGSEQKDRTARSYALKQYKSKLSKVKKAIEKNENDYRFLFNEIRNEFLKAA